VGRIESCLATIVAIKRVFEGRYTTERSLYVVPQTIHY